ncbi:MULTISPECIES: hypothetical protein [Chryseobacterium]|uniref:PepSY-associated TM region n=1 Tax=Chryseobacterium oryzae TaxID=2929799 RepID=A0ABY4BCN9_9FLAO|nr:MULTISPECIES: hypothetical protein [Chryseobacterium]UOE36903.1 hypothetical protein MTP08_07440 [Chryseobacterium oryzae]
MDKIKDTKSFMRITHRYLGYFMAGIMVIYSLSGVLLIYRDTDFLKKEIKYDKVIDKNLDEKSLGKELKIKNLEVQKTEGSILKFKQGTYDSSTGQAKYSKKELPYVLDKMAKLHKAKSEDKLSPLNAFFGICLFFFVISSFWMFNPKSKAFKRGMKFTVAGLVAAVILLLI